MNLDYVAGFFDGDGAVSLNVTDVPARSLVRKVNVTHRICFAQSTRNLAILQSIQGFLGMGRITTRRGGEIADLHISRRDDVSQFIRLMRNRLVVKREPLLLLERAIETLGNQNRHYNWQQITTLLDIRQKILRHSSPHRVAESAKRFARTRAVIYDSGLGQYYQDRERLANLLSEYRESRALTIAEMARRFGSNYRAMQHYVKGDRVPRRHRMESLMRALQVQDGLPRMTAIDSSP